MKVIHAFGRQVPERAIIGLVGNEEGAVSQGLRDLASEGRYWSRETPLDFAQASGLLLLDYALDSIDPLVRLRARRDLSAARQRGATILLASWDSALLTELSDEIWWFDQGGIRAQGDPAEVLGKWRESVAAEWLKEQGGVAPLEPAFRAGDGRAHIRSVQLMNEGGEPVRGWMSGDAAEIRAEVEFVRGVSDPVIGVLIRTRIGLNVYGTNTELEHLQLGPREAGDRLQLRFRFRCDLCPGEYTVTVASHDPDGTWHEWLEDIVAFTVGDVRYTAGVANLRAQAEWELY